MIVTHVLSTSAVILVSQQYYTAERHTKEGKQALMKSLVQVMTTSDNNFFVFLVILLDIFNSN